MKKWYSINKDGKIVAEKDGLYYKKGDVGGNVSVKAEIEENCWVEKGGHLLGESKLSWNVLIGKNAVVGDCIIDGVVSIVSGAVSRSNISGRAIMKVNKVEDSSIEGDIVICMSEAFNESKVVSSKISGSGLIRGGIVSDSVVLGKFMILDSVITYGKVDGVNSIVKSLVKNKSIHGNNNERDRRITRGEVSDRDGEAWFHMG